MPLYRDRLEEHQQNVQHNSSGLLNIIGASKNLTTGYAGWMTKTIVTGTGAATVFGLAGLMLGWTPLFGYSPCLGFMVSQWHYSMVAAACVCRYVHALLQ